MSELDKLLESIRELREAQREAQRLTDEQLRRTDEQLRVTDEQLRRTDEQLGKRLDQLGKQIGEFTGGWGKFVENLLAPSVIARVTAIGFHITSVHENVKSRRNGQVLGEVDLLLEGRLGRRLTVIVVSTKSQVRAKNVDELVQVVSAFPELFPAYRAADRIGALAGVGFEGGIAPWARGVAVRAERVGFWVIRSSGEVAEITNAPGFEPKVWRAGSANGGKPRR